MLEQIQPESVDVIDFERIPDGVRRAYSLRVVRLADGSVVSIPVNVVAGLSARPCLVAVAGIHGDEGVGVEALGDLWRELDPALLNGRLIIVPIANTAAFAADARLSPLDGLDLNRVFPGSIHGSPSQQLANRLFERVLTKADFLFSMHSWSKTGEVVPYVEFDHRNPRTARTSFEAACAAGFEIVRLSWWATGLMTRVVNEAGIPGLEAEIGGLGVSRPEQKETYKRHLRALIKHLGILPGSEIKPSTPRVVRHIDLFTSCGGVLRLLTELAAPVHEGDLLAVIEDHHGNEILRIVATCAGFVGAIRRYTSVHPGDLVFRLFTDATYDEQDCRT